QRSCGTLTSIEVAGDYRYRIRIDGECAGTLSYATIHIRYGYGIGSCTLTINPNPVAVITGDFDACQGSTATLNANAGMTGYQWTGGLATGTINPGVAGTYTVTITDANGCTGTASQAVTIYANPVPAINGTFVVCQGFNATLNATAGFNNYQWSGGQATSSISPSTSGTYTVTVTDGNGCTGTVSQLVTVNSNPVPSITGTSAVCDGASSTFDAGAGYASYQWANGLGSSQTITVSTTGTYTVTVTDNNGCVGTDSQALTVNPNPVAVISGDFDACQGATATLNANPGMTLYSWSSGQASATINPGTAGQYTVTITDGNGCTGTTFEDVTIHPNPVPSIAGTFEVCQGFAATLNASPGYTGYSWNSGSAAATINPTVNGTYTVTVTDVNSCTGSASQLVTINANPVPVIAGNNVVCDGTSTTFDAGAYASYVWSDGTSGQTITTGVAGTYTVTVTDQNGCIGTASQTLTVNAIPTGSIFGSTAICFGATTPLYFNFTGTAPFTYSYSDGNTTFGPYVSNTTTTDVPVNPNTSTTYTLVSLNDNNCPGTRRNR
ncbi:MAG: hypothetical protein ACKOYC_06365, partial [Bacteroidota bacterium]